MSPMNSLNKKTPEITELVLKAAQEARRGMKKQENLPATGKIKWPIECIVGPGLEGAIACESNIGYVNGGQGSLIYRGYDIFDLCAYSTYEEVSYLLIHGKLPTKTELEDFTNSLKAYRDISGTLRLLLTFPIEKISAMAILRIGTHFLRDEFTDADQKENQLDLSKIIGTDEDSIPMETMPMGEKHAIYEFVNKYKKTNVSLNESTLHSAMGYRACYGLISGVASLTAATCRIKKGQFPIQPDNSLSHAGNLLYMMTGKKPTPVEERIMDISLILHADHGMNASTFASMVVASTLSDMYFSIGSGIAALNGPLHGGANEKVIHMLEEIGDVSKIHKWYEDSIKTKTKIMGFGHRVYKAYDPRARVLRPLAEHLAKTNPEAANLFKIASGLEKEVIAHLGEKKGIFPNVDFYSGILYKSMGIETEIFTPIFAVSRVAGWTARVLEYLQNNRIFRPRAMYTGTFDEKYVPIGKRK